MISIDWKERLVNDCVDFLERKIPMGDFDFDIIYNAYPSRNDSKIPRDVIVFVSNTLGIKMAKKHKNYLTFCDYIWAHKGSNGRIAFACIISKFVKKDQDFYLEYSKNHLSQCRDVNEMNLLFEKVFLPVFKKQPNDNIDVILKWMRENDEKTSQFLIKMVLKIGKSNQEFLKKFIDRLENKWFDANPEFVKINGIFLKNLAKLDYEVYLSIYKNYKNTREPIFVEILTLGLVNFDEFLYEIYENWSKSGNARLKKAAIAGLRYLKKRK